MRRLKNWQGVRILLIFTFLSCVFVINQSSAQTFPARNAPLIINHSDLEQFDQIPDEYIEAVKDMVVVYTGGSHGRQIPCGLLDLEKTDSKYAVAIEQEGLPPEGEGLRISRSLRTQYNSWKSSINYDDFWYDEEARENVRRTLDYHENNGTHVDVIVYTWCWHLRTWSETQVDEYLSAFSEILENEYPDTTFVYMTDTSDRCYENRWLRHQQIREYVNNNNKVLFDFGELETWSSSGVQRNSCGTYPYMDDDWNGSYLACEYGDGHINQAGTLMKAKAFWVLLAKLAGWEGDNPTDRCVQDLGGDICSQNESCPETWLPATDSDRCCSQLCESLTKEDINLDGTVDVKDLNLSIDVVLGLEIEPGIVERADVNLDGSIDSLDILTLVNVILSN
jgi:hypothetical protein